MPHEVSSALPQNWIEQNLTLFKEREQVNHIVGLIGGSNDLTPENAYLITSALFDVKQHFGRFAIQTGGTKGGIPELGVLVAKYLQLPVIGVYPQAGEKYSLKEKLNLAIPVDPPSYGDQTWGSETPVFVAIPDIFILAGGEWGTSVEVGMIMKRNSSRASKGLPLTPIIVIDQSGKLAGEMPSLSSFLPTPLGSIVTTDKPEVMSETIINHLKSLQA